MTVKKQKDNTYKINLRFADDCKHKPSAKFLLCLPQAKYCEFVPELNLITNNKAIVQFKGKKPNEAIVELQNYYSIYRVVYGDGENGLKVKGKYFVLNPKEWK